MPGYIKDENSLATGIPNRTIGPETGSFGNANATNTGDTGQGTNQEHQSVPPQAAGLEGPRIVTDDRGEHRSFAPGATGSARVELPQDGVESGMEGDVEPVYQQIADGGDRFDPDKHLHEDDEESVRERRREERIDKAP